MLEIEVEAKRLEIQRRVDSQKNQKERNKLGQFATPTDLAKEILEFVKSLLSKDAHISFLDPAIGTGSFYSALLQTFDRPQITKATGYEIDDLYAAEAIELWKDERIDLHLADFTYASPPMHDEQKWNLLICNPPYVRHHHLSLAEKLRLQASGKQATGIDLSMQTGLYGYFLLTAHSWMMNDGLAVWLLPSEFMDVNYGKKIREYLLTKVSLLRLHRFAPDSVQFDDALVSSAIICFKKTRPVADQTLDFTYGGTLLKPQVSQRINLHALTSANKWNKVFLEKCSANQIAAQDNAIASVKTLSEIHSNVAVYRNKTLYLKDFFEIKRGLATGANDYFILTEEQISHYHIPGEFTIPVLPSPRYMKENIILADKNGYPQIKNRQFLFTSDLPENVIRNSYPAVWEYLQRGLEKGINQGYLCKNRKRWYQQEKRPDCQFLFAYMGRVDAEKESPFRFLLNYSNATVTNAYYIMYPKSFLKNLLISNPDLLRLLFDALKEIPVNALVGEGRIYGGGLHKMEPKELANVPFSGFYFQYLENMKHEREEFVNLSLWDEEIV